MHKKFEDYVNSIISSPSTTDLAEMKEEFLNHLEDSAEDYITLGYSEEDAIKLSLKDFGNINLIKKEVFFMKKSSFFILTNILAFFFGIITVGALYFHLHVGFPLEYFSIINPFIFLKIIALISIFTSIYMFISKQKVSKDSSLLKKELTKVISILSGTFFLITCLSIYCSTFMVQPIFPFGLNPWDTFKLIALSSLIIAISLTIYKRKSLKIAK